MAEVLVIQDDKAWRRAVARAMAAAARRTGLRLTLPSVLCFFGYFWSVTRFGAPRPLLLVFGLVAAWSTLLAIGVLACSLAWLLLPQRWNVSKTGVKGCGLRFFGYVAWSSVAGASLRPSSEVTGTYVLRFAWSRGLLKGRETIAFSSPGLRDALEQILRGAVAGANVG